MATRSDRNWGAIFGGLGNAAQMLLTLRQAEAERKEKASQWQQQVDYWNRMVAESERSNQAREFGATQDRNAEQGFRQQQLGEQRNKNTLDFLQANARTLGIGALTPNAYFEQGPISVPQTGMGNMMGANAEIQAPTGYRDLTPIAAASAHTQYGQPIMTGPANNQQPTGFFRAPEPSIDAANISAYSRGQQDRRMQIYATLQAAANRAATAYTTATRDDEKNLRPAPSRATHDAANARTVEFGRINAYSRLNPDMNIPEIADVPDWAVQAALAEFQQQQVSAGAATAGGQQRTPQPAPQPQSGGVTIRRRQRY